MEERLEQIKNEGLEKIEAVKSVNELEEVRKELTGKKSGLSSWRMSNNFLDTSRAAASRAARL